MLAILVATTAILAWTGTAVTGHRDPGSRSAGPTALDAAPQQPTSVQHVVTIMLENQDVGTILEYAPYMAYLWNTYGHASHFYGACHDSLPDYTSIESGRYYVCGGNIPIQSTRDLPDVLEDAGLSWMGYFESMPTACDLKATKNLLYQPDHNPFLISSDIRYNASRCDAHDVSSDAFNKSVSKGQLPSFSFYAPNYLDDCHNSNLTFCDHWLESFLAPMLNSSQPTVRSLMSHTAFLILFDEGLTDDGYSVGTDVNGYCVNQTGESLAVCGGHTYLVAVSPLSSGAVVEQSATDFNVESTIEWLLGVGGDGGYDGTASFPALTSLFGVNASDPPTAPTPPTNLQGTQATNASITWNWSQGPGVTNDTVYLWHDSSCAGSVDHVASTGAAATSYTFTRLASNGSYSAEVQAWNLSNASRPSSCVEAVAGSGTGLLLAPTNLTAAAETNSSITWNWSQVSGVTNDTVYLWHDSSCAGDVDRVASTGGAVTSYTFSRLAGNASYSAEVQGWNGSDPSARSVCVSATTG